MKKIILAAGGSGGHLFPAKALAQHLKRAGVEVFLISDARVQKYLDDFPAERAYVVNSATITSMSPLAFFKMVIKNISGIWAARQIIRDINPDVVVGFGGYPSIPTVIAARLLAVLVVIHEQNTTVGRANRLLARWATGLALGFDQVAKAPKIANLAVTGIPLREDIIAVARINYIRSLGDDQFRLLIIGGSQGARIWAQILPEALAMMTEPRRTRLKITQQCSNTDNEILSATYSRLNMEVRLGSFFTDIAELMADSQLILTRAGASSVAELAAIGRPALLVPYPHAREQDQLLNARWFAENGGGVVVEQTKLSPKLLARYLEWALDNPDRLAKMAENAKLCARIDASKKIFQFVEQLINQSRQVDKNHC